MDYLLLGISVLSSALYNTAIKRVGRPDDRGMARSFWLNSLLYLVIILVTGVKAVLQKSGCSLYTVLLGAAFGILTALNSFFRMKAMALGEMSFTTLFVAASMIIPGFSGALIWGEALPWTRVVGTFVMILAVFLAATRCGKKSSPAWFFFCIGTFLFNGFVGVLQKVQGHSDHAAESGMFLFTAFLTAGVVSVIFALYFTAKEKPPRPFFTGKDVPVILFAGGFSAYLNVANLYLAGVLSSALFFPVMNGGSTMLSLLLAILLIRERPTKKQLAALAAALGALVLLLLP